MNRKKKKYFGAMLLNSGSPFTPPNNLSIWFKEKNLVNNSGIITWTDSIQGYILQNNVANVNLDTTTLNGKNLLDVKGTVRESTNGKLHCLNPTSLITINPMTDFTWFFVFKGTYVTFTNALHSISLYSMGSIGRFEVDLSYQLNAGSKLLSGLMSENNGSATSLSRTPSKANVWDTGNYFAVAFRFNVTTRLIQIYISGLSSYASSSIQSVNTTYSGFIAPVTYDIVIPSLQENDATFPNPVFQLGEWFRINRLATLNELNEGLKYLSWLYNISFTDIPSLT